MKKFLILALLVVLVAPLATVGAQADAVLRVGMVSPIQLDPQLGTNDPEVLFNRQIYDYLVDLSANGELVPQLATDWEISDDGLTYTFNLRNDVSFHDGSAFSSADVVFSFNRMVELESPALNLLGGFTVEATDDSTVVFTLEAANADFLFGIASRWSVILKDGATDVNVITDDFSNFVGTGPFVLRSYSDGVGAELTANESYWIEGEPMVGTVSFVFIDDLQAQIDAVRDGAVDFIFKVAADRIPELQEDENIQIITRPTNLHPVIRLKSDEGSLGEDPRIMQAMKLATDRELVALDLFGEPDVATVGNNNPVGPVYGSFFEAIPDEYDPEAACALLEEAGYPDGLGADEPIEFYVVDAFNYPDMGVILQDQWEQACIFVEILVRPENVYYGDNEWLEVDLGVTGWGDRPTPQQYFVEAYVTGASFNESAFSDAEVDELVAQAAMTADIEERAAIYGQIATIFEERGSIIIPFFAPTVAVTGTSVDGLDIYPFVGRTDLRQVTLGGM